MESAEKILSTLRMVQQEHLDVRTITMGINLAGCADRNVERHLRQHSVAHHRVGRKAG